MTSLAYTASDPVALAKALTAYAKVNPTLVFKAGMVEGRVIDIKSIQDLANMPSKEQLIGKVMYLVNSSAQRLAVALNGAGQEHGGGSERGHQGKQIQRAIKPVACSRPRGSGGLKLQFSATSYKR